MQKSIDVKEEAVESMRTPNEYCTTDENSDQVTSYLASKMSSVVSSDTESGENSACNYDSVDTSCHIKQENVESKTNVAPLEECLIKWEEWKATSEPSCEKYVSKDIGNNSEDNMRKLETATLGFGCESFDFHVNCVENIAKEKEKQELREQSSGRRQNTCFQFGEKGVKTGEIGNLKSDIGIPTLENTYCCEICGVKFTMRVHLEEHVRVHTAERFYCESCGANFTQIDSLKRHMVIHTIEESYNCSICGNTFSHKSSLEVHIRIHGGENPLECKICGTKFSLKGSLKRHIRTHTGEKPFHCQICGLKFTVRAHLDAHVRVHTGYRPFHCESCGAKFTQMSALQNHMRTHTGEKPFSCKICGAKFTQNCNLKRHMVIHTDEKPFCCEICGAKYRQSSSLKRHENSHK